MSRVSAVLLISAIVLVAADAPPTDDSEALRGSWSGVSLTQGGKSAPEDLITKFKTKFDGKNYTNVADSEVVEEGGYAIDATKIPKTIDFEIRKGEGQGKKQLGIFQIDGDKLTLVVADPGSPNRPKSIKIDKTDPFMVVVLKRVKR
jgi:uncharacterized protein (TIGR03067 family)